jgi:hypothetical protein
MTEAMLVLAVVGYLVVLGVVLYMQPTTTDDEDGS